MPKENSSIVYKFILYKIKKLVCDSRGKARFISNFDNVIYEIFGVENFAKKLNHTYSNRDFVGIIDKIGMDYLLELTNNSKLYNILTDLVDIDVRIQELRKEIRKSGKKNKRDKSLIKEINYLNETYKQAIKLMRKRFGIKNSRTAYKRRYHAVNELLDQNDYDYDDEFTSILMRDDDYFFSMDDDDDDDYFDEYESSSELEDFVRRMNGGGKSGSRRPQKPSNYDDFDIDEDDDDYEIPSPRRRSSPDYAVNDRLGKQVDSLSDTVELLASSVQSMMNEREYAQTNNGQTYNPSPNNSSVERALDAISAELSVMKNNNKVIAHALDNVLQRQDDLTGVVGELISDITDDEDDDDIQVSFGAPKAVDSTMDVDYDKYPDIHESMAKSNNDGATYAAPAPTREELIDLINQSGNEQAQTVTTTSVKVEEATVTTEVTEP